MLIGAHVGIAHGYTEALRYALEVGAECAQVFAKSPRQWHARALDPAVATAFRDARAAVGFGPLVTHTAYLINLASIDPALAMRSVDALADELERAALLGADAVITHIGTTGGTGVDDAAARVAASIESAFARVGGTTRLLLENTAGAGTTFGNGPDEIGAVLAALRPDTRERVAVCLDTCHAHAAGFDMSSEHGWVELLDAFDRCCGPGSIRAVHANDCMFPCGSRKDRHAWIGDGTIGVRGFSAMVCQERLRDVPAMTEMPGQVPEKDVENITRLKRLRDECVGRA